LFIVFFPFHHASWTSHEVVPCCCEHPPPLSLRDRNRRHDRCHRAATGWTLQPARDLAHGARARASTWQKDTNGRSGLFVYTNFAQSSNNVIETTLQRQAHRRLVPRIAQRWVGTRLYEHERRLGLVLLYGVAQCGVFCHAVLLIQRGSGAYQHFENHRVFCVHCPAQRSVEP
jgi:hypothetical protein